METMVMRYESTIKMSPTSYNKINEQFALVDILLCYEGKNRNRTYISKETIENSLYSLYGCPIIGERIIKDDGTEDFGTHGGKIVVDSTGIKFEQTTKAFGFITKDAVDNAKWIKIIEKDGHTNHEYLQLKGCVIWNERFEEAKELLEKDYPQSMEISVKKSEYNSENYLVITDFVFTAACILGSDVEPCFESSCIGRHYNIDEVQKDLNAMINAYDTYKNYKNPNVEEGLKKMENSKIVEKLSEFTYKNSIGDTTPKYSLIDLLDNSIGVFDREDQKVYSMDCVESDGEVIIDIDSKTECSITYKKRSEKNDFNIANEIKIACDIRESEISTSFAQEYNSKINEMSGAFAELKSEYDGILVEYNRYKNEEKLRIEKEKHIQIDNLMDKYAQKIGRLPKFLCYRAKIDYSRDLADIENELILMVGEAMMDNSNKQSYSYTPSVSCVSSTSTENSMHNNRYGNLFDKFINN